MTAPSLSERLAVFERDLLVATLRDTNYNVHRTATVLGVDRGRLYQKLKRFGITLNRHHLAPESAQDSR